jgi:phosphatidate cytidylyltransferase
MPLHLPTFFTRTGSAIIFAAIMLAGLLWIDAAFVALIGIILWLCVGEYMRLAQAIDKEEHFPSWLAFAARIVGIAWLALLFAQRSGAVTSAVVAYWLPLAAVLPVGVFAIALLSKRSFLKAFLYSLSGLAYVVLPCGLLLLIRWQSATLPVYLIALIWANDTLAYLVGSFIGKTPLSPISPKKTWEGTIGGMLLTIVGGWLYGYFSHAIPAIHAGALAIIVAVMGTYGDLLESKLKRMANLKDSGAIMPGHGGALDRFDSLLVATPFYFAYVVLLM